MSDLELKQQDELVNAMIAHYQAIIDGYKKSIESAIAEIEDAMKHLPTTESEKVYDYDAVTIEAGIYECELYGKREGLNLAVNIIRKHIRKERSKDERL